MKILTFDIGGTLIKSALYDEEKGLFNFQEHSYPSAGRDGLLKVLHSCMGKCDFDGIGISTAGLVDEKKGSIIFCSNAIPNYTGTGLKEIFEVEYKKPVWVLNDVNAAALGEAYFGAGKNYDDFICLTYGTGVGGAIVINKEVYNGKNGYAGEIGHIVTHLYGKDCVCGGKGCYNEYASTRALIERCMQIDDSLNDGRKIFAKLNEGNIQVKKEIDEWIDEIVYGLINIVHIFNPPALILGGGIMSQEYIISEVNRKLKKSVMPGYKDLIVLSAFLGNNAGLMGASKYALKKINKLN